jgi:hypothetical protein
MQKRGPVWVIIDSFVEHYNNKRYHESLKNLTPADVYYGRGSTILLERERIKRETIKQRVNDTAARELFVLTECNPGR